MDSNKELFKQFANGLVLVATAPNKKAKLQAAEIVQELSYSLALSDIKATKEYLIERATKENAPKQVIKNLKSLFPTNNGSIL
tara:strand:+ start:185 stop:433 length:249 start_codon:yes stop_codon:yes gene_type:complete